MTADNKTRAGKTLIFLKRNIAGKKRAGGLKTASQKRVIVPELASYPLLDGYEAQMINTPNRAEMPSQHQDVVARTSLLD